MGQIIYPIPFYSSGGTGKTDWGSVTMVYDFGQSRVFGVVFFLMGILFLYLGFCVVKNVNNK